MGPEAGVAVAVEGAVQAVNRLDVDVTLVGRVAEIEEALTGAKVDEGLSIVDAPDVITMDDNPTDAVRGKPNASINVGLRLVKDGAADAFRDGRQYRGGNDRRTAALGRVRGISRPALAALFTGPDHERTLLLDVGANADAKPIHLVQYAHMGSAFMERMYGTEQPTVGLVSNGSEDSKGNSLTLEVNAALRASQLNFYGNVEGNDLTRNTVHVAVVDGFTETC